MIKKTLCFSNPDYLSLRDAQLVIKLPEVEKAANLTEDFKKSTEVTRPIEDIGVVVLDHKQITITQGRTPIYPDTRRGDWRETQSADGCDSTDNSLTL